ncbi:GntR family transcriptional regulator [Vibrio brasiliensis]|uniref:GntR family transcriptional regulator n=1 Tax=Vibrio brasiliensis TaxID=170652 RepID=UPI001EFCE4CC|nr:GntR family transcriptional regulator [Vibrio brasiliensis]MCG9751691.1 GntR family transcriptional regulator [Vibrio brasiliensis]MCG9782478.1 GntR family transcriptional regulator [Vibrio brasiliensis]
MTDWNETQPIFRQLADRIIEQILQGVWLEGQALPSVRSVASDLKINHITVMKGYQLLVDEDLVEKKRGQGMFVAPGALDRLKAAQKLDFIEQQIPSIATKLQQLDIPLNEFIERLTLHVEGKQ